MSVKDWEMKEKAEAEALHTHTQTKARKSVDLPFRTTVQHLLNKLTSDACKRHLF